MKNIRLYLDIEKVRFEDKFDYSEELNDECNKAEIQNMILQPFFENVIKHAVYETFDKVYLTLKCSFDDDYLKIHLINNFDESSKSRKGAWHRYHCTGPEAGAGLVAWFESHQLSATISFIFASLIYLPNLLPKGVSAWNRKAFTASSPPSAAPTLPGTAV